MEMAAYTVDALAQLRDRAPLVHNITNFVVMETTANILLAAGASPVMAHCRAEVEEMVALAGALVLNIGTLQEDWVEAMCVAGEKANALGKPVILDPVGAGATTLRTSAVRTIMARCRIAVLRGNASEVLSLVSADVRTKGVDSSLALSDDGVAAIKALALEAGCIVAVSGAEDCITDGRQAYRVANGQPLMTKVTGIGCGLSAITAAFCAVARPGDHLAAATAAFAYYGICGDRAIQSSDKPGTFFPVFLDRLYDTGPETIRAMLKVRAA